jgi:Ig-like domain from next to BRCA1 gene
MILSPYPETAWNPPENLQNISKGMDTSYTKGIFPLQWIRLCGTLPCFQEEMMKKRRVLFPAILLTFALYSCNFQNQSLAPQSQSEIQTLSAQTVAAIQWGTLSASQGGGNPQETPGSNPATTENPLPSVTSTSTYTDTPTNTFTPTSTPLPCNRAHFVADVTIPDGWETTPNDHFLKTWRLQNNGSCTWTSGYSLVFDHGDQMGAPDSQQLTPGTVAPGGTIDVSVNLLSPATDGTYQGFFKLRASDSTTFGVGEHADTDIWVKIVVQTPALPPPAVAPTTQNVNASVALASGAQGSVTASCPAGTVITGGGFSTGLDVWVYTQLASGNGWIVYARNNAAVSRTLTASAVCLTYPSASTAQVVSSATASAGHSASGTATCPAGTILTGGGYSGMPNAVLRTYSVIPSGNSWVVTANNSSGGDIVFNVYAVCLSGTTLTTVYAQGNATVPGSGNGFAYAVCPGGKVVTGGGFGLAVDLTPYFSGLSSGKWYAYAHNSAGTDRALLAHIVCLG